MPWTKPLTMSKEWNASLFEIDCYCLGWMSSQGKMMISAFQDIQRYNGIAFDKLVPKYET